jgi:hypothetical protein
VAHRGRECRPIEVFVAIGGDEEREVSEGAMPEDQRAQSIIALS